MSIILQVVLLYKFRNKDAFKLAYFILEQFNDDIIERHFSTDNSEFGSEEPIVIRQIAKKAFKNANDIVGRNNLGSLIDLSRDTEKSLFNNYKSLEPVILGIVNKVIQKLSDEMTKEKSELISIAKEIFTSDLQDHRQSQNHEKIKQEFRKKIYQLVGHSIGDLAKLYEMLMEKNSKKSHLKKKTKEKEDEDSSRMNISSTQLRATTSQNRMSNQDLNHQRNNTMDSNQDSSRQDIGSVGDMENTFVAQEQSMGRHQKLNPGLALLSTAQGLKLMKNERMMQSTQMNVVKQMQSTQIGVRPRASIEMTMGLPSINPKVMQSQAANRLVKQASSTSYNMSQHNFNMSKNSFEEVEEENEDLGGNWLKILEMLKSLVIQLDEKIPDRYLGEIFNDEINGVGIIDHKAFEIYKGEFKDSQASGLGELMLFNQNIVDFGQGYKIFRGIVERNLPNGFGTLIDGNNHWQGRFVDGKRAGVCICRQRGRVVSIGWYQNGTKDKYAITLTSNQNVPMMFLYEDGIVTRSFDLVQNPHVLKRLK
jgi:hypothetical protein